MLFEVDVWFVLRIVYFPEMNVFNILNLNLNVDSLKHPCYSYLELEIKNEINSNNHKENQKLTIKKTKDRKRMD